MGIVNFYFVIAGHGQRTPLLEEQPNSLDSEEPVESSDKYNSNNVVHRRLSCYSCEGEQCDNPEFCTNAITVSLKIFIIHLVF